MYRVAQLRAQDGAGVMTEWNGIESTGFSCLHPIIAVVMERVEAVTIFCWCLSVRPDDGGDDKTVITSKLAGKKYDMTLLLFANRISTSTTHARWLPRGVLFELNILTKLLSRPGTGRAWPSRSA